MHASSAALPARPGREMGLRARRGGEVFRRVHRWPPQKAGGALHPRQATDLHPLVALPRLLYLVRPGNRR